MKNRILFPLFILILSAPLIYKCDEVSTTSPGNDKNLITNPSFEENGDSSLAGWFVNRPSAVHFTNDTQPNGGNWAITIDVMWGISNKITSTVKIPAASHIYKFSFWSKYSDNPGYAEILLVAQDSVYQINRTNVDSESWKNYSILDTITSVSGDSLQIKLSGGFSNISPGKTYFDLCTLELLE